jgi:epoxyqueuosine reductase
MPPPRHELKETLRELALDLGFNAVGFTRLDLLPDHTERLRAWVRSGRVAHLGYLAHTLRSRGRPAGYEGYAWCRSVLVATHAYREPERRPPADEPHPAARSRHARGVDYHAWFGARLASLQVHLELLLGRPTRSHAFCDTSALPEKRLAVAAGLGRQGRHTLLLTPRHGSWVTLGGLLLELDLPPDAASTDACPPGCRRCVDACPTGALDGECLDARRCLSYWTTSAREPAPCEIAAKLEGRVYGCDACQEACPDDLRSVPQAGDVRGRA